MKTRFQFKNTALLMAMAAVYPLHAFGAAGTIQFTTGDVKYRRGATTDSVARGSALESGDAIETGANGRAQIRFTDGGMVSLQPNSQFNISRYVDANDPKQDAFLVDLLRGGMRAITGLIGKRNRENYKVTTSTATVGIRGSAFSIVYLPDGTLAISTEQDAIEVCTKAGCTGLTAGESVRVVSPDREPVRTSTRATLPTPEPTRDPVTVGDEVKGDSTASAVPPKPSTPSPSPTPAPTTLLTGMAFTSAGVTTVAAPAVVDSATTKKIDQRLYLDGTLVVQGSDGQPTLYVAGRDSSGNVLSGSTAIQGESTGSVSVVSRSGSLSSGNLMILGTWSGSTWKQGTGSSASSTVVDQLAFVTGQPTSSTALSSLKGIRGEYNLAAATPVFTTSGVTGQVLDTSKLTVDFLGAGVFADVSIDVRMPDSATNLIPSLSTVVGGSNVQPGDLNLRGGVTGTGAGFEGSLAITSQNCSTSGATLGCGSGSFKGFVSGDAAKNAGVSFTGSYGTYGSLGGAATFAQSTTSSTPASLFISGATTKHYAAFSEPGTGFTNTSFQGNVLSSGTVSTGGPTFAGFQLTNFKELPGVASSVDFRSTSALTTEVKKISTESGTFGSVGAPGETGFIGWGYWNSGRKTTDNEGTVSNLDVSNVHYVVGVPSASVPSNISASTYGLVGGTAPTATLSGVTQTGQLVSGSLSVNFQDYRVGVDIQTKFGTNTVSISYSSAANFPNLVYRNGTTFFSCGTGATINGFFTGSQAERAGLVYRTVDGTVGVVNGAASFVRTSASAAVVLH